MIMTDYTNETSEQLLTELVRLRQEIRLCQRPVDQKCKDAEVIYGVLMQRGIDPDSH
jgi:hypothetical protein